MDCDRWFPPSQADRSDLPRILKNKNTVTEVVKGSALLKNETNKRWRRVYSGHGGTSNDLIADQMRHLRNEAISEKDIQTKEMDICVTKGWSQGPGVW